MKSMLDLDIPTFVNRLDEIGQLPVLLVSQVVKLTSSDTAVRQSCIQSMALHREILDLGESKNR